MLVEVVVVDGELREQEDSVEVVMEVQTETPLDREQ
jgi:hypothetical protein